MYVYCMYIICILYFIVPAHWKVIVLVASGLFFFFKLATWFLVLFLILVEILLYFWVYYGAKCSKQTEPSFKKYIERNEDHIEMSASQMIYLFLQVGFNMCMAK